MLKRTELSISHYEFRFIFIFYVTDGVHCTYIDVILNQTLLKMLKSCWNAKELKYCRILLKWFAD